MRQQSSLSEPSEWEKERGAEERRKAGECHFCMKVPVQLRGAESQCSESNGTRLNFECRICRQRSPSSSDESM